MRVAIYARYSSDNQRDASIDDQFRECQAFAERQHWTVVKPYSDAALSGSSTHRAGLQALMTDASAGRFDVVLAESLDRLSRDMEDTAAIHKKLSFLRITLVTLAEGEIGHLHVGLKGTMNALYLKDLADKTRRGLRGRVEAGKSAGGLCYGYRVVRSAARPATGEREVDPAQAAIVVRIFNEFINGASPKTIAKKLNAERVHGPGGGAWGPSTIYGNTARGTGILNNELYVGRLVWNRLRYVKDPDTGKRVSRPNPASAQTATDVPDLRIIAPEVWAAVKDRQQATRRRLESGENLVRVRRPTFLLTGLTKCGVCGSGYTMASRDRLACAGARDRGVCSNKLTIRRQEVEARVLSAMQERLWRDDLFEEFCREFVKERNRLHHEAGSAITVAHRDLGAVQRQIDQHLNWIGEEWNGQNDVMASEVRRKMEALVARKSELTATLAAAERARRSRPLLHPEMGKIYRAWVLELRTGLVDEDQRAGAVTALRAMVQQVVLTPENGELAIELVGDLAAMLVAANPRENPEDLRRQVMVVAGAGFEPATFGL